MVGAIQELADRQSAPRTSFVDVDERATRAEHAQAKSAVGTPEDPTELPIEMIEATAVDGTADLIEQRRRDGDDRSRRRYHSGDRAHASIPPRRVAQRRRDDRGPRRRRRRRRPLAEPMLQMAFEATVEFIARRSEIIRAGVGVIHGGRA